MHTQIKLNGHSDRDGCYLWVQLQKRLLIVFYLDGTADDYWSSNSGDPSLAPYLIPPSGKIR